MIFAFACTALLCAVDIVSYLRSRHAPRTTRDTVRLSCAVVGLIFSLLIIVSALATGRI